MKIKEVNVGTGEYVFDNGFSFVTCSQGDYWVHSGEKLRAVVDEDKVVTFFDESGYEFGTMAYVDFNRMTTLFLDKWHQIANMFG